MTPTRAYLLKQLVAPIIEQGFYIESDDGQPDPDHVYCATHAIAVAERWGASPRHPRADCPRVGGSDNVERCAIWTCSMDLDTGGLTNYGIDSALTLTEEDPFSSCISVAELELSAQAMMPLDPRWAVWDRHVLAATMERIEDA